MLKPVKYCSVFRGKSEEKIDKKKLLEIARKNTISMLKQGALPEAVLEKTRLSTFKAGGKTVDELTGESLGIFQSNPRICIMISSFFRSLLKFNDTFFDGSIKYIVSLHFPVNFSILKDHQFLFRSKIKLIFIV